MLLVSSSSLPSRAYAAGDKPTRCRRVGVARSRCPSVHQEPGPGQALYVQYVTWWARSFHGDFKSRSPFLRTMGWRSSSAFLPLCTWRWRRCLSQAIAKRLGTLAVIKRRTMTDYVVTTGAVLASIPNLVAILCVLVFALYRGLPFGPVLQSLQRLHGGAAHLAAGVGARYYAWRRAPRASPGLDARRSAGYVDTARSWAAEWKVIFKYTLRNALTDSHHCCCAVCRLGVRQIEASFPPAGIASLLDAINSRDHPRSRRRY